jgi:hypothetical protein
MAQLVDEAIHWLGLGRSWDSQKHTRETTRETTEGSVSHVFVGKHTNAEDPTEGARAAATEECRAGAGARGLLKSGPPALQLNGDHAPCSTAHRLIKEHGGRVEHKILHCGTNHGNVDQLEARIHRRILDVEMPRERILLSCAGKGTCRHGSKHDKDWNKPHPYYVALMRCPYSMFCVPCSAFQISKFHPPPCCGRGRAVSMFMPGGSRTPSHSPFVATPPTPPPAPYGSACGRRKGHPKTEGNISPSSPTMFMPKVGDKLVVQWNPGESYNGTVTRRFKKTKDWYRVKFEDGSHAVRLKGKDSRPWSYQASDVQLEAPCVKCNQSEARIKRHEVQKEPGRERKKSSQKNKSDFVLRRRINCFGSSVTSNAIG